MWKEKKKKKKTDYFYIKYQVVHIVVKSIAFNRFIQIPQ